MLLFLVIPLVLALCLAAMSTGSARPAFLEGYLCDGTRVAVRPDQPHLYAALEDDIENDTAWRFGYVVLLFVVILLSVGFMSWRRPLENKRVQNWMA